ncbi:hypothetical protein HZC00_04655 [Candidatus Kaiserbacteria bacterium]|nr:hypothetical protein [Candidatus Kaiserbacteria bacterium]
MGTLEHSSRKKIRRQNLTRLVIGSVGLVGMLGVAAVAPNVLTAMAKLGLLPNARQKESINRARDRLLKQGLLKREDGFLRLTPKGEAMFHRISSYDQATRKPPRWDGRWRVLIFDIPERRKGLREKMRRTLTAIGFIRLQDSVWVYPYDCEDFVALLKADFKIGKDVLYLIVEEMEGDRHLRKYFGIH